MEPVAICAGCKTLPAIQFCLCCYPLIFSCRICADDHCIGDIQHVFFPISEARHITAKPEYTRAKSRLSSLQAASFAVKSNFPQIDEYISSIEQAYSSAISYLSEVKARKIAEMRELEGRMEQYIRVTMNELYDHVLEAGYKPAPGLPTIAWGFREGAECVAAQIFVGRFMGISKKRLEEGLGLWHEITIVGFPHAQEPPPVDVKPTAKPESETGNSTLTMVFEDFMLGFDCRSLTWCPESPLSRSISSYGNSSTLPLPEGFTLCCGGGFDTESHAKAYRLSPTGQVDQLQSMVISRSFHSLLEHKASAYAFGGRSGENPSKRCEKLSLKPENGLFQRKWLEIAQMCYPREGCNPCQHLNKAYFCGGATDGSESFDFPTESFDLLPFRLPDANSPAFTVMMDDHLYVVMHEDIVTWKLMGSGEVEYMKHEEWGSWGNSNPLLFNSRIYVPSLMMGGVIEIDLRSQSSRLIAIPGSD